MAPRQLLLEGPAIEPLLKRVREEHGSAARIVRAERVRVGGVVGFFAREHFEVTVEVSDSGEIANPVRALSATREPGPEHGVDGLAALMAAAEQVEREDVPAGPRYVPPDEPLPVPSVVAEFEAVMEQVRSSMGRPDAQVPAPEPAAASHLLVPQGAVGYEPPLRVVQHAPAAPPAAWGPPAAHDLRAGQDPWAAQDPWAGRAPPAPPVRSTTSAHAALGLVAPPVTPPSPMVTSTSGRLVAPPVTPPRTPSAAPPPFVAAAPAPPAPRPRPAEPAPEPTPEPVVDLAPPPAAAPVVDLTAAEVVREPLVLDEDPARPAPGAAPAPAHREPAHRGSVHREPAHREAPAPSVDLLPPELLPEAPAAAAPSPASPAAAPPTAPSWHDPDWGSTTWSDPAGEWTPPATGAEEDAPRHGSAGGDVVVGEVVTGVAEPADPPEAALADPVLPDPRVPDVPLPDAPLPEAAAPDPRAVEAPVTPHPLDWARAWLGDGPLPAAVEPVAAPPAAPPVDEVPVDELPVSEAAAADPPAAEDPATAVTPVTSGTPIPPELARALAWGAAQLSGAADDPAAISPELAKVLSWGAAQPAGVPVPAAVPPAPPVPAPPVPPPSVPAAPEPAASATPDPAPAPAPLSAPSSTAPSSTVAPEVAEQAPPTPPAPTTRRAARAGRRSASGDAAPAELVERLAGLGVPGAWLTGLPADRSAALRHLAVRIAEAPVQSQQISTLAAHPVVVVLAERDAAVPVAESLAVGLGGGGDAIAVLGAAATSGPGAGSHRSLPDRSAVLREVRRCRIGDQPLVLVLPAPIGASASARSALAATLVEAEPDEVWAVVDATRRHEDVGVWLHGLSGGRGVDAVALTNLDVTCAPAAHLALPVPVVLMGDRPATPAAWVSMLAARLTAQDLS